MQGQPEQSTDQVPPALPPSADLHELLKEIKELKAGLLVDSVTHDNPTFEGLPWEHPQMLQNTEVRHLNIPVGDLDESLEELVARDARLQYILSPQAEEHVVRSSLRFDQDGYSPQQSNPSTAIPKRNPSMKISPVPSAVLVGTPATPIIPAILRTPAVAHYTTAAPTFAPPLGPYATPPHLTSSRSSSHTATTSTQTTAANTPMPPASIARKAGSRIARPSGAANASTPSSAANPNRSSLAHPLPTYTPPISARGSGGGATPSYHASGHLSGTALHRSMQLHPTPPAPRSAARPYASTSSATPSASATITRGSSRIPAAQPKAGSASASPSTSLNISRSSHTPTSSASTATGPLGSSVRKRPPQSTGAESAAPAHVVRKHAAGAAASSSTPGPSSPRNPTLRSSAAASSYGTHHTSRLASATKSPRNNTWSSPSSPRSRAAATATTPTVFGPAAAAKSAAAVVKPLHEVAVLSAPPAATESPVESEMEVQLSRPSLTLPTGGHTELLGPEALGVLLEDDEGLESWLAASGTPMEEDVPPSGVSISPGVEGSVRMPASSGGGALVQRTSDELLRPLAAAMEVGTIQDAWMDDDADTEMNLLMSAGREPAFTEPVVAESSVAVTAPSPPSQRSPAGGDEETSAAMPVQEQSPQQLVPVYVASSRATGDVAEPQGTMVCKVRELLDLAAGFDPHGGVDVTSEEMWRNLHAEASSIFSETPATPRGANDGHMGMLSPSATVFPRITNDSSERVPMVDIRSATTALPSQKAVPSVTRVSLSTVSTAHCLEPMTGEPVTLIVRPPNAPMAEDTTSLAGSAEARFVAEAAALAVELGTPRARRVTVGSEETSTPLGFGAETGLLSGCSSSSKAAQLTPEESVAPTATAVEAAASPAKQDSCQDDEHNHDSAVLVRLAAEAAAVVVSSGGYGEVQPYESADMTMEEPRGEAGMIFWQQSSNASSIGFDAAAFASEAASVVRHLTEGGADDGAAAQPALGDEDAENVLDGIIPELGDVAAPVYPSDVQLSTVKETDEEFEHAHVPIPESDCVARVEPTVCSPMAASEAFLADKAPLTGDLAAARNDVTGTPDRPMGSMEPPSPSPAAAEDVVSPAADVFPAIQSTFTKPPVEELGTSSGSSDTSVDIADIDQGARLPVDAEASAERATAMVSAGGTAAVAVVVEAAAVLSEPQNDVPEDTVMELSDAAERQEAAGDAATVAATTAGAFAVRMDLEAGMERCSLPSLALGIPVPGSSSVDEASLLVDEASAAIGASVLPAVTLTAEEADVCFTSPTSDPASSASEEDAEAVAASQATVAQNLQRQNEKEEELPPMPAVVVSSPMLVASPRAMQSAPAGQTAVFLEEAKGEEDDQLGSAEDDPVDAEVAAGGRVAAAGVPEATMHEAAPGAEVSEVSLVEAETTRRDSEGSEQLAIVASLGEHIPAPRAESVAESVTSEVAMEHEEELPSGEGVGAPASTGPSPAAAAPDTGFSLVVELDMQRSLFGSLAASRELFQAPSPRFSEAGTAASHPLSDCDIDIDEDVDNDGVPEDLPHKAPAGAGPALIAAAVASSEAAAAASNSKAIAPHPPVKYAHFKTASEQDEVSAAEEMAVGGADAAELTADAPEADSEGEVGDSTPRKRVREADADLETEGLEGRCLGSGSGVSAADSVVTTPRDLLLVRTPCDANEKQGTPSPKTQPPSATTCWPPSGPLAVSCLEPGHEDEDEQQPLPHAWQVLVPHSPSAGQGSDSDTPKSSGRAGWQGTRGSLRSMLGGSSRLSRVSSRWDYDEGTTIAAAVEDAADAEAAPSEGAIALVCVSFDDRSVCVSSTEQTQHGAVSSPDQVPASPTSALSSPTPTAHDMAAAPPSNTSPVITGKAPQNADEDESLIPAWKVAQVSVACAATTGSPSAGAPAATAPAASLGCRRSLRSISLAQACSPLGRGPVQAPAAETEMLDAEPDGQPGSATAASEHGGSPEGLNRDVVMAETKSMSAPGTAALCGVGADVTDAPTSSGSSSPSAVTFASGAKPVVTYSDSDDVGEVGLRPAWKTRAAPALSAGSPERSWGSLGGLAKTTHLSHHLSRSGSSRLRRSSAPDAEDFHFISSMASAGGLPGVGESADATKRSAMGEGPSGGTPVAAMNIGIPLLARSGSRSRTVPGNLPPNGLAHGSPGSSPKAVTPSRSTDGVMPRPLLRMSSGGRQLQYHMPSDSYSSPRRGSHYETGSGGVPRLDTVSESGSPVKPQLSPRLSQRRLTSDALGCMPLVRRSSNGGGDPNVDAMRPAWQVLPLPASPSSIGGPGGDSGDGASPSQSAAATPNAAMFASMRSSSRLSRMSSGIPEDLLAELRVQAQAAVGHLQGQHHDDSDDEMQTPSSSSEDEQGIPGSGGARGPSAQQPAPVLDDGYGGTVHAWKVLPLRAPLPAASAAPAQADAPLPVATSRFSSGLGSRAAMVTVTTRAGTGLSNRLSMSSSKVPAMQVSFESSGSVSTRSHTLPSVPPPVPEDEDMPTVDVPPAPGQRLSVEHEDDNLGAVHAWKLVTAPPAAGTGDTSGPAVGAPQVGGALTGGSGSSRPHPLGARASLKSMGSMGRGSRLSRTSIRVEDYVDDTYSAAAAEGGSGTDGALPPADDASQSAVAAAAAAAAVTATLAAEELVNALSHRSHRISDARPRSSSKVPYIRPQTTTGVVARSVDGSHDSFTAVSPSSRPPLLRGSSTGSLLNTATHHGAHEDGHLVCESPISRALNSRPSLRSIRSSNSSRLSRSSSVHDIIAGTCALPASELSGILEEQDSLGPAPQVPPAAADPALSESPRPQGTFCNFPVLSSSGAADGGLRVRSLSPPVSADGGGAMESSSSPSNSDSFAMGKQGHHAGWSSGTRLSRMTSMASEAALEDIVEEDGDAAPHGRPVSGSMNSGTLYGTSMASERASSGRAPPPAPSAGLARMCSPSARHNPVHAAHPPAHKHGTLSAGSPSTTAAVSDDGEDASQLVPAWKVLAPPPLFRRGSSDGREGEVAELHASPTTAPPGTIRQASWRTLRSNSRLSRMTCGVAANDEDSHAVVSEGDTPGAVKQAAAPASDHAVASHVSGGDGAELAAVAGADGISSHAHQARDVDPSASPRSEQGGSAVAADPGAAQVSDSPGVQAASGALSPRPVTANEVVLQETSSAKQPLGQPSCEQGADVADVAAKAADATMPTAVPGAAEVPASQDGTPAVLPRPERRQRPVRRKGGFFACFACFGGGQEASE